MAIVQSSLAEEILSRQERAVLRGIYRASQLSDALITLEKVVTSSLPSTEPIGASKDRTDHVEALRVYLRQGIVAALVNTKVPAKSLTRTDSSTPATEA